MNEARTTRRAVARITAMVMTAALATTGAASVSCKRRTTEWPAKMRTTPATSAASLVQSDRGDVVLLVLYASWCSGCRGELPDVDRLGLTYEGKGLHVVALSLDEDPRDFAELVAEQRLHFDLVRVAPLDNAELARQIGALGGSYSESIPYAAVFARDGKLVGEWKDGNAGKEIERTVTSLL